MLPHSKCMSLADISRRLGQDIAMTSPLWATRGMKWTGTADLSREQWSLWKNSFEAIQSSTTSKETREIVRTAV